MNNFFSKNKNKNKKLNLIVLLNISLIVRIKIDEEHILRLSFERSSHASQI